MTDREALGTLLKHVLEVLEADIAAEYDALGLSDYRPRYSPVVRELAESGGMSIRELATAIGVTHSAASQTVAQMSKDGFVKLEPGADARRRIVSLTARTRELLPLIDAEWRRTAAVISQLDAELSMPLADLLIETMEALRRKSFAQRSAELA